MKYIITRIIVFITFGILFFGFDSNQNLYSFPDNKTQNLNRIDEDSSSFSSDGPIIIYENGKIISYTILPDGTGFKTYKKQVNKNDLFSCFVDETNQKFSFHLKDSIKIEKDEYKLPEKMFMISDIEGNFKGFAEILQAAGVINKELKWTYGKGHLVLDGDFFDRAVNVTECLWLIYKLEDEAELQGGKVHLILGNHEMMDLRGNFKYLRKKYLENAKALNLEYNKWYAPDTELGKWLRSKNGIEKIGDYLFVHGGISKDFPKDRYALTEINDNIRTSIDKVFKEGEASKDIFIGSQSPLWYRGIANQEESSDDVEQTLKSFNATKMILGHTIFDEMKYLYDKKVIVIDLEHQINTENGKMFGLCFENSDFYVVDINGIKTILK